VLSTPEPYLVWYDRVLNRLQTLYPRDPHEPLGEVVPREALDPAYDFRIEDTEALINQYLIGLDYTRNPFLNNPERMIEEGFPGTPYTFDIQTDRAMRGRI
jgi:hypothetical protein